jgi:multidrug efflux system outer membrane protein
MKRPMKRQASEETAMRYSVAGAVGAGLLAVVLGTALPSCEVGPDYQRPAMAVPTTYRSADTQPTTAPALDQAWWRLFHDDTLTALEESALAANTDLQAAMARVSEARAAVDVAKSQYYPSVTANPTAFRSRTSANAPGGQASTGNLITVPVDLSYEIDIWGRVRRSVEAAQAPYQASIADLEVVRQTLLADVANDYFTIRSLDAQAQIIDRNLDLYRSQIKTIQQQLAAGLVTNIDVLQVQVQLEATRAQGLDLRRQRTDAQHALATLLGRAPTELTVAVRPLDVAPPEIPPGLPAELLRRRPDVAEAELNLIAANAQVGVATANFYPVVKLTGLAGYESVDVQHLVDWQSRIWSIGPSISAPIFEGGQLTASLRQAKARSQELQASYRGTVLGAFRDVEVSLTDIHLFADQADAEAHAVAAAREYLRLAQTQYDQGIVNLLQVIDADRAVLTNELSAAQTLNQRMAATILLIKAMGGGWDSSTPPRVDVPHPESEPESRAATVRER